ncbi:MAG: hypothetical protein KIY12_05980 [Thermoplasmata archaeon]|uniref:Uncharacterized protein n=1 Tax=Candidatus Sysuiplasma superficiale TaxID=2823368 RepID=A0A8J8CAQ0_9ARCH|nr:hypothetical protein [Candidatus Sysuiplasma superficiale]MBX8644254.1 hypothetical protein [Candidatus Sysuiplasma superficiale]MCL4347352.1 hypothetical protein [Candidatus Thermoplasmatota archaeon]MCL5437313.1 hypothetical protein [Candidatus Thermoplasmatota archaeon]
MRIRYQRTGFSVSEGDDCSADAEFIGCKYSERHKVDAMTIIEEFGRKGLKAQPVRSEMVFGMPHLRSAFLHAARACERGRSRSDDIATEFLVYASCERQISRALEKMKVKGNGGIVMMITPPVPDDELSTILQNLGLERDDSLIEMDGKKVANARSFGIHTDNEHEASESILERIAMLDLTR